MDAMFEPGSLGIFQFRVGLLKGGNQGGEEEEGRIDTLSCIHKVSTHYEGWNWSKGNFQVTVICLLSLTFLAYLRCVN